MILQRVMESYPSRGNTIFCNMVIILGFFSMLNHLSKYVTEGQATGTIQYNKIYEIKENKYLKSDQMYFSFDLDVDFTPTFTWNTRQIFVYITAEYTTKTHPRNEVTVWDTIIKSSKRSKLKYLNETNEYQLRHITKELLGHNISLKVRYRVVPYVGFLSENIVCESSFKVPDGYIRYNSRHVPEPSVQDFND
eukprot:GHVR01174593.1.p1 GENE.GHVR01174593.1~~GHVR01174593.1.p1  ORF type:complete len:193 (+),score=25.79 GHVR01174593.1:340-918(+)